MGKIPHTIQKNGARRVDIKSRGNDLTSCFCLDSFCKAVYEESNRISSQELESYQFLGWVAGAVLGPHTPVESFTLYSYFIGYSNRLTICNIYIYIFVIHTHTYMYLLVYFWTLMFDYRLYFTLQTRVVSSTMTDSLRDSWKRTPASTSKYWHFKD